MPIKPKSKPRNRRGGEGSIGASRKGKASNVDGPSKATHVECKAGSHQASLLPTYLEPEPFRPKVMYLKTKEIYLELSDSKLFQMTELNNPIVLYGQCFSGKTYIFKKTSEEIFQWYSIIRENQWIKFISLKDAAKVLKSEDRPKSFIELCAICLKIPVKTLKKIFKPLSSDETKEFTEKKLHYNLIKGELFLDGLDEMPPREREIMMEFLPELVSKREEFPIRIWISARSYLKPVLMPIFGVDSSFEIIGYNVAAQMKVIAARISHMGHHSKKWALNDDFHINHDYHMQKIATFTRVVYTDLEGEIKGFRETIGSNLSLLSEIASKLGEFRTVSDNESKVELLPTQKSAKDILDLVAADIKIRYELKYGTTFPHHRLNDLVAFAMRSVYNFENDEESNPVDDELMKMGFLVGGGEDGLVKFLNQSLANYFVAMSYVKPLAYPDGDLLTKFLVTVLCFERDAREFRKFYDQLLLQELPYQNRCDFLFEFLVEHYRLATGMEEEWEKIRHDGTILHLAIMEGFHNIAFSIMDVFDRKKHMDELKKFLLITAPVNVSEKTIEHDGSTSTIEVKKARHSISMLSMMALFSCSQSLVDYFETYRNVFGTEEIQREFNTEDQWTPLHYAAAHSNLWFIDYVLQKGNIKLCPAIFNPDGQLPLHLLMTYSWSYSLFLKNHASDDEQSLLLLKPTQQVKEGWGSIERESEDIPKVIKRKANGVRSMVKDLTGNPNLLREAQHTCLLHMLNIGDHIDAGDKNNMTVLHFAAKYGPLETVKFLASLGANLEAVTFDGKTPTDIAGIYENHDIFEYLIEKRLEVAGFYDGKFLLESDEDPESEDGKADADGEDSEESSDDTKTTSLQQTRAENKVEDGGPSSLSPVPEEADNKEQGAEANVLEDDEDFGVQHSPSSVHTVDYVDVSPYLSNSEESSL